MHDLNQIYYVNKRGVLILHGGYKYHKKRCFMNGTTIWRCSQWRKNKCPGSITINKHDETIIKSHAHSGNCDSDYAGNDILLSMKKCQEQVTSTENLPIPQIYENFVADAENSGFNFVTKIPTYESVKSKWYQLRNINLGVQKTSHKYSCDVEVPSRYAHFLVADFNCNNTRILLFANPNILKRISQIKHVFCDGAFRSTPDPFDQIYL